MNKMLFITQREKEGEGRTGLVTQLGRLIFYIIISEIKPEEAYFLGKQNQRVGEIGGPREPFL